MRTLAVTVIIFGEYFVKLFGTSSQQSLLAIVLLVLNLGCSRSSDTRQVSGDIKTRLPWASEGGEYSLQEVLLKGINSLYEFSGSFATFYIYPSTKESKISGRSPKTRFLKTGELFVPQDTMTQQVAVIYAHMQGLAELDNKLGAGGVNTWPRDVGVSVRYSNNKGVQETNNAFYDGQTDSMLIVPYTQENLPIPVNAGILAHEHFHSLYFKLVEKKVFKSPLPLHGEDLREAVLGVKVVEHNVLMPTEKNQGAGTYSRALSRALNEGLADFWAWVYTGDPDFLALSLPSEKSARTLNVSGVPREFTTAELFQFRLDNSFSKADVGEHCWGVRVLYCLGSEFARTLTYFSRIVQDERSVSSSQARHIVGSAVIKALPLLREAFLNLKEDELLEPVQFFVMVQSSLPDIKEKEKLFIEGLVEETLKPKVTVKEVPAPQEEEKEKETGPIVGVRGEK